MSHHTSSSDDEAPEAFSFDSQKKAVKGHDEAIQKYTAELKRKEKEKNRARDRVLKERAQQAGGKKKKSKKSPDFVQGSSGSDGESEDDEEGVRPKDDLEARMERAMREAEEESDADDPEAMDNDEEFGGFGADPEGESGSEENDSEEGSHSGMDEDEDEDEDENEEYMSEEEQERPRPKSSKKANYLPDHLFQSAFAQAQKTSSTLTKRKASTKKEEATLKKRKRPRKTNKDIVVGSRTIRTIPKTPTPLGLKAPAGAKKFLAQNLNLKGQAGKTKAKGWERRPANLGVMRRSGPAAHFARDS
ncbi:hypothetical protein K474DRAFT_1690821 [Panus rudis PR-1116 ss-1]|nr:hypothetical protein K474DRAFT_1690821 [Panus rudis PR-1116 ss-1]